MGGAGTGRGGLRTVRLRDLMFVYRPSKDMCWGHALRPKDADWRMAKKRLQSFLDMFFETLEHKDDSKFIVRWKDSALPNIAWPEEFSAPESQKRQEILFLFLGERVGFPLGLVIPISPQESSSYEFIGRFSASAPFKMSPKHFSVVVRTGKKGTLVDRKPDAAIAKRLNETLSDAARAAGRLPGRGATT